MRKEMENKNGISIEEARKQKSGFCEKQEYTPFTSLFNIMYTH
jgi:hypothetical protein